MARNIVVDRQRCMGSGNCSFWAANTFDLDEEGLAVVLDPDGDDASKIQNAVNGCPTQAITVTER